MILSPQENLFEAQNKNDKAKDERTKETDINLVNTPELPLEENIFDTSSKNKADEEQNDEKKEVSIRDSLNPISNLVSEREIFTEEKAQRVVSKEEGKNTSINVIGSLNEIFVSKENIDNISDYNEIGQLNFTLPKISAEDYIDSNKTKQDIGLKGEYFILKYEKGELTKNNRTDLAIKVRHISKDEGDYVGYDILSYDEQGNEKYIEVKTSVNGYAADFFLTENEMNKIKMLDNYFIYRVFDFDKHTEKGNLYIVNCKKDFADYFTVQPTQYKVSPRKK